MPRHVIRPGDTIKTIVKKYNANTNNLAIANTHLENLENLNPGDVVYIPAASDGTYNFLETKNLKSSLRTMMGFSVRQIQEHYKLYQDYVIKINEIRAKLQALKQKEADSIYSEYRALKTAELYAVNNCKLHEYYFENMGGRGGNATGNVLEVIVRDFGSYEYWEKDFRATCLMARNWAILGYDFDDGHLHNYGYDEDAGLAVRIEPLLVVDLAEHAYFLDYGTNRTSYLDAFAKNIDWAVVKSRFTNIKI
ncbi:Fe-Mn family superoxide dismutase [Desulforamulus aeronauticus]|uniref:superoxide dismutase n=1 Tax=Desulforamulus aeronauticus DSM 10349 TaxID=1121421 RepID=A0A1M6W5S6_9FIRM|nr:Fe-Mn family superoxide dismutase [Desulforamulus aeronauticus]SHK89049.1 superoxide dismutase, Fe-Mn family [Desulforamulus aeronauticus DSM 10349]